MIPAQVSPPEFALTSLAPSHVNGADVLALPVLPAESDGAGPALGPGAAAFLDDVDLELFELLDIAGATGKAGEVVDVPLVGTPGDFRLLLLVGVGDGSPTALRRAGAALARRARDRAVVVTSVPAVTDEHGLRAFVEGAVLGSFGFSIRRDGPTFRPVEQIVIADVPDDEGAQDQLRRALAIAGASWRSRALATVPSNIKSPEWLADEAVRVATEAGLTVTVWDEQKLAKEGFGGVLAVGSGSATPPRFVQLDYRPKGRRASKDRIVLVGKGITFDTGGLSIKPGPSMVEMKRDMTGAGVVLSVLAALADLDCRVPVTGLLPLAENAIGAASMRPGDVITHYGGRTTEVTNTDAEGRLVLADALAYAVDRLKPTVLVDIATLTGTMKVALGQRLGGIFATGDPLADALIEAGAAAGEPLWRMPIAHVYDDKLTSKVADADNGPLVAKSLTAALFLEPFTGGLPWAHLDIASVGDSVGDEFEWTPGPTGWGARNLLYWLEAAS